VKRDHEAKQQGRARGVTKNRDDADTSGDGVRGTSTRQRARATLFACLTACAAPALAQSPSPDPLAALDFLEGSWASKSSGAAVVTGHYAFRRELDRHILGRHAAVSSCKGPDDFDCEHGDLFYVFQDAPGQALKAIYFDNEGHVLHYGVTLPTPDSVEFLSEPGPGPRFRLVYVRQGDELSGKFQMQAPGQSTWKSYLEWSGPRD